MRTLAHFTSKEEEEVSLLSPDCLPWYYADQDDLELADIILLVCLLNIRIKGMFYHAGLELFFPCFVSVVELGSAVILWLEGPSIVCLICFKPFP